MYFVRNEAAETDTVYCIQEIASAMIEGVRKKEVREKEAREKEVQKRV